jgi:PTH1 family peptidyl-tRNA hydrolase
VTAFTLIAGLGNPGSRYAANRHNIGFQAVETLAEAHRLKFTKSEHQAQTAHGRVLGRRVILAKPQTWMNDSGKAVGALARFYKVPPAQILVIYDDMDIPLGTIRYRAEGSNGGHRGLGSVIQHLSTQAVPRLRLGIGRPPGQMDPAAYVLQDFSDDEQDLVWDVLREARRRTEDWLKGHPVFEQEGMTWRIEASAH